MATHNIDQFFKRKTSAHEVQPSAAAWDKVASQLGSQKTKKTIPYMKIAATVLLLLVSGLFVSRLYNPETSSGANAIVADHPVLIEENSFEWEIPKGKQKKETALVAQNRKSTQMRSNLTINQYEIEKFDIYKITKIEKTSLAVELPAINNSFQKQPSLESEKQGISIKYIASEETINKEEINPLKKIFNYATSNSPVEIYSDIRSAKDNLLSKTLD